MRQTEVEKVRLIRMIFSESWRKLVSTNLAISKLFRTKVSQWYFYKCLFVIYSCILYLPVNVFISTVTVSKYSFENYFSCSSDASTYADSQSQSSCTFWTEITENRMRSLDFTCSNSMIMMRPPAQFLSLKWFFYRIDTFCLCPGQRAGDALKNIS